MDAVDLDVWIAAQQPPVLEEIRQLETPRGADTFATIAAKGEDDKDGKDGLVDGGMRSRAIREAAFSLAAQTALAWRYEKLLKFTKSQEGTLDKIASFAPFIIDEHMLLPSITQVQDRYELSQDDKKLRTIKIQYQISEPPKAITQPPTWRDYLWREFEYPEDPHPALMPRNDGERAVWSRAIDEGWKAGLRQAELMWENNLNEMVRDIRGRINYRILESRGIVDRPVMAGSEPELTRSSDGHVINAGDTVYSITVPVTFNSQQQWGALWQSVDSLRHDPEFNYEVAVPSPKEPQFEE
ncbi:type IV secretory system conjugative DNA transfer family protein [Marinobacter subterrani]|uniref:type IV secretory system conjugative DNA transfer family protein n=1 Tax=Marinobacter subterrani TaxID=1658765 RepID=UPI002353FE52|nr:type IV secretory system conjugative DNA transfer family protein [Marinobacter subterrani]